MAQRPPFHARLACYALCLCAFLAAGVTWRAASAQPPAARSSLAVIFLIDQSRSMGDPLFYCTEVAPTLESDPNNLRFLGPQFALDWLGRARLSHQALRSVDISFSTIYFGGYGRNFNVFDDRFEDGLVPVRPDSPVQWDTFFTDAVTSLSPAADNIYAHNQTRGLGECPSDPSQRNLTLGSSDPQGALEQLERTLAGLPADARVLVILLTDGLPQVDEEEGAPLARITSPKDPVATQRYLATMADRVVDLRNRFPGLSFHVAPLPERLSSETDDWQRYSTEWQRIDPGIQVVRDTRTLGARFQELLNEVVDAYGLGAMAEVGCGETFAVPPLSDQLLLTIHKPEFSDSNRNQQLKLYRGDALFAQLDQDQQQRAMQDGIQMSVSGVASPIQVVALTGPVGGKWRLQCPDYGLDGASTRVFVQEVPLPVVLVQPLEGAWVGLPAPIDVVGQRTSGERVALLPYVGPNGGVRLAWGAQGIKPRIQPILADGPAADPGRLFVVADAAGTYTATLAAIEVDGIPFSVPSPPTLPVTFSQVRTTVDVEHGANFLWPVTVALQFNRSAGNPVRVPSEWDGIYEAVAEIDGQKAGAAWKQQVAVTGNSQYAGTVTVPEPGTYTVTARIVARARPAAALTLPPQRFTVTALPAGPNQVELLPSVVNWLQSYPITVPLLDEAGEPLLLPMSDARHQYTGELRLEAEAPGDQAVERIPLTLQGNVLLGELTLNVDPATRAITVTPYLVHTDLQTGEQVVAPTGAAQVISVVTPHLALQRLSVPTDDGCLAPLSVGASLVTAEMPFQVGDASGAPYRIAPFLVQEMAGQPPLERSLNTATQGWINSELFCFADLWSSHQVTYTAGYRIIEAATGAEVQVVKGLPQRFDLDPTLVIFLRRASQNEALKTALLALSAVSVVAIVGTTIWRRRLSTPARLRRRDLPEAFRRGLIVEIQKLSERGEELARRRFTERARCLESWQPDILRGRVDLIEVRQEWSGNPTKAYRDDKWTILVTVRDKKDPTFLWLENAPIVQEEKSGVATRLRLPGNYMLTAVKS